MRGPKTYFVPLCLGVESFLRRKTARQRDPQTIGAEGLSVRRLTDANFFQIRRLYHATF